MTAPPGRDSIRTITLDFASSFSGWPVDEKKLLLGGGLELDTPYGVFHVPNISSHNEDDIGA